MGLLNWYITKRNSILKDILNKKNYLSSEWENFLKKDTYLTSDLKEKFSKIINQEISEIKIPWYLFFDFNLKKQIDSNIDSIDKYPKEINEFNERFVQEKIKEYAPLLNNLNNNQKRAIIKDDLHNLVVAGAGSGKTETLITRLAYLTKRKGDRIKPARILALAFQRDAAKEMQERLKKSYGIEVEIRTFHSLGKKILEEDAKLNKTNE